MDKVPIPVVDKDCNDWCAKATGTKLKSKPYGAGVGVAFGVGEVVSVPGAGVVSLGSAPALPGAVSPGTELVESGWPGISLVGGVTSAGAVVSDPDVEGAGVIESLVPRSVAFLVHANPKTDIPTRLETSRIFFMSILP